jgi:hypothetical protein
VTLRANGQAGGCDLCGLLWRTYQRNGVLNAPTVKFERTGSFLRIKSNGLPVLSVVRSPEQEASLATDFQIGFVGLPEAGTRVQLGVVQHWLKDCDIKHRCLSIERKNGFTVGASSRLPTRLIDVGVEGDKIIRLWETGPDDTGEWTALSHQWGGKHFSTTRKNLQQHIAGMGMEDLPATFRDAVAVTRALGHQYLWIDSICIIQGLDGDFRDEAKRMEDVYSGAYCVIAASSATDHFSGFLKPRKARDFVGILRNGKPQNPFFVCQTIDSFKEHVLDGALHSRGWVFQEHALARRTIFFTEHQTYFECGDGVRCETSTKMKK